MQFFTEAPGHHIHSVKKSTSTRLIYVFFFLLVSIVAYVLSNWSFSWMNKVDVLQICSKGDNECKGALVVYRLTFGLSLYHVLLGFLMIGVKSAGHTRAKFQDGYWPLKVLVLGGFIFASFFIPNSFFVVYGWASIFCAAFFILIQLVLLIEFAYSLNDTCVRNIEDEGHSGKKWYALLFILSFGSIAVALAGSVVMIVFYGKDCSINQFFIVFNIAICLLVGILSISEKIREYRPSSGVFQSGVVMLYCTYLIYSAINSEPSGTCGSIGSNSPKESTIIIGACFTIISVCYSAFRASDSNEILGNSGHKHYDSIPTDPNDSTTGIEDDECECTAYNYTFFHFTFAFGAMYLSALLTNWATMTSFEQTTHTSADPTASSAGDNVVVVDSGMVSVWVKVVSSWVVVLLYLWSLLAPIFIKSRNFDY